MLSWGWGPEPAADFLPLLFLLLFPPPLSSYLWFVGLYRFSFKRLPQTFPSVGHCMTTCACSLARTAGLEKGQKAPSLSPDFCHPSSSFMNSPRPFPWHMRTSLRRHKRHKPIARFLLLVVVVRGLRHSAVFLNGECLELH